MRGDEKEKLMHSPKREGERDWGLVRTGENDEKEGFYFPICCCSLPSLVLRSGPRPLWDCCCHSEQGAEKRRRTRRRRKGGGGGGGEREEEEEDAVAAVRSRGCPTSPPAEGWIFQLAPAKSVRNQEKQQNPMNTESV